MTIKNIIKHFFKASYRDVLRKYSIDTRWEFIENEQNPFIIPFKEGV